MQDVAPFKFSKESINDKVMLELVLASRPVHMSPSQDALWSRFNDLDLAFFEKWWKLPDEEMISWDEVQYDEWTSNDTIAGNEVTVRNYGTRSKAVGVQQHAGLVRQVAFGDFRQLTYTMEGKKNGMSVGVAGADIPEEGHIVEGQVILNTPAKETVAQITFDWMFTEQTKDDPENLLNDF